MAQIFDPVVMALGAVLGLLLLALWIVLRWQQKRRCSFCGAVPYDEPHKRGCRLLDEEDAA